MHGLGQFAVSRAHMMMIAIDMMVMVRLGGLRRQALATHASPEPMSNATIRARRKGARSSMIPRLITTRNALGRWSSDDSAVGPAVPTGFSTVQAQASQAVPAFKPSPGAACGTLGGESGLADGEARTPVAGGGGSATSCAPLFDSARGCSTPNAARRVIKLLRGTMFFDQKGRRRRRGCAMSRVLLLQATIAMPRLRRPPITRRRCRRSCIASGANRRSGRNSVTNTKGAGYDNLSNIFIHIEIETLTVMHVQLLSQPRRGEDEISPSGALRISKISFLDDVHRADRQAIRPRDLC